MIIKDFQTFINEELSNAPKTKEELYKYIDIAIESAKKEGTYPDINLNNIDVSKLGKHELDDLFGDVYKQINPDISNWNIKYIPCDFFSGNEQIKEFTIPDSVTSIEYRAFCDCDRLRFVNIPNSVTSIGDGAFDGCRGLTSIEIPNSVTSIGEYAFFGCIGLTSVTIPNSVTSIGGRAFARCIGLTSVTIPNSVANIGNYAFYDCRSLTSVTIPKYCHIDENSFPKNCRIIK